MRYATQHSSKPSTFDNVVGVGFLFIIFVVWLGVFFLILLGSLAAIGAAWRYRVPLRNAFRPTAVDANSILARRFLVLAFSIVSIASFLVLPFSNDSARTAFVGALCALPALYLAKLELKLVRKSFTVRFGSALGDAVQELAIILAIVAGIYAVAEFYLRHSVIDAGTLGQLRRLDDRLLYARVFLSEIKFSAWQTCTIAILLLALRFVERRWIGAKAGIVDATWHSFRTSTKWMSRLALAALALASFTLLASRESELGGQISARFRDFEESYSQLRRAIDKSFDARLQRDLVQSAWQRLSSAERAAILESIQNRIAAERLKQQYDFLKTSFHAADPVVEHDLSWNTPIVEPEVASAVVHPESDATSSIPSSAEALSLRALQAAAEDARQCAKSIDEAPAPEPVKSIGDVIQTKLLDMGFDLIKERLGFFEELSKHFPGVGELLDAAWGSGSDAALEQRKEAKARVLRQKLEHPDARLNEILSPRCSRSFGPSRLLLRTIPSFVIARNVSPSTLRT
ncbi:MAG TPA: hypothetical protein VKT53_01165 [Candidatus Acidoferrum sp.]|nr:hypothetical protein [Candidatus Acidoferrum sp.]